MTPEAKKNNRFVIRDGRAEDLKDLFVLARHLDSYNLPADIKRLRRLLSDSAASFAGRPIARSREKYLFVLEDTARKKIVGCSLILAQHGTPGLPHLSLRVFNETRRSQTLRRSVVHKCLKLEATTQGPTEVGGLVLLPGYRRRPEKLGRWLSYVRFLFIAARRRRFQKRVLAEYLPAFLKKGVSPFWNYFGQKFTGLDYPTADRLSIDNKEFILALFPSGTLYQDFFPASVVRVLGLVGAPSLPAAALLRRVGFRFNHQIEPFDGGPYFEVETDRISLVARAQAGQVPGSPDRMYLVDGGAHVISGWGRPAEKTAKEKVWSVRVP